MTIELDDESYILGIWFSSDPETHNNWLCCIIKDPDNVSRYKGWCRFFYSKEKRKSWAALHLKEEKTEDEMINSIELIQEEIEGGFPEKDCLIVKGNIGKLLQLYASKEWLHDFGVELTMIH